MRLAFVGELDTMEGSFTPTLGGFPVVIMVFAIGQLATGRSCIGIHMSVLSKIVCIIEVGRKKVEPLTIMKLSGVENQTHLIGGILHFWCQHRPWIL